MDKKLTHTKTLGPISAKVIYKLLDHGKFIFTLEDACEIYGQGRQETSHFLRVLVKRGILTRLKSGVFLILEIGKENTQLSNWPVIARVLAGDDNYYISHYSAMRLHGMTTHPFTDVMISISKRRAAKKIHHLFYKFIYLKPENFWGLCELWVTKQEKVSVSDLERTLLDGLERPELCGGIKEVIRGIWSKQKQIDWSKLTQYAKKYHTKAAVKRLGFILEMLKLGIDYIPALQKIINQRKDYILLDPNGSKSGQYLSRWHVQINMNTDELKASIWG